MCTRLVSIVAVAVAFFLGSAAFATENPYDEYFYQRECPEYGAYYEENRVADEYGFIRCQCTSYVADKLSRLLTARYWENHGQADIMTRFVNDQYYMPQTYVSGGKTKTVEKWSDAHKWRNAALRAEIGVTGARDNFVWDPASYSAVFHGDVAWWDEGHVAFVESAEPDAYGKGVLCVTISEYNWSPRYDFSRRRVCKGDGGSFPDTFLHIDQDHAYCILHPDVGSCPKLFGKQVASSDGKGSGIGGGSDFFNLKVNNFHVVDATGNTLDSDTYRLTPGQTITVKIQVKATNGDTHDHMRDGKDTIEIDLYWRQGTGNWTYLKREYTKAVNLPSGATHTENVPLTVPNTNQEPLSFKAKIDAEDEAMEANEGDNWTPIEVFDVNVDTRTVDFTSHSLQFRGTPPTYAGDQAHLGAYIVNIGNSAPSIGIRSNYSVQCSGTGLIYLTDDGTDAVDLAPNRDNWEETLAAVTMPNVAGACAAYLCADYQGAIQEADEANNCSTLSFTLQPRPKAKLVITRFQDEVGCCTTNTGTRIRPDIWVRNDGPVVPAADVRVLYQIASPVATAGRFETIGWGSIRPSELPPGGVDEDYMDGSWSIPKNNAWKKQWHTVRACLREDGGTPIGNQGPGEICATYGRYSKK